MIFFYPKISISSFSLQIMATIEISKEVYDNAMILLSEKMNGIELTQLERKIFNDLKNGCLKNNKNNKHKNNKHKNSHAEEGLKKILRGVLNTITSPKFGNVDLRYICLSLGGGALSYDELGTRNEVQALYKSIIDSFLQNKSFNFTKYAQPFINIWKNRIEYAKCSISRDKRGDDYQYRIKAYKSHIEKFTTMGAIESIQGQLYEFTGFRLKPEIFIENGEYYIFCNYDKPISE